MPSRRTKRNTEHIKYLKNMEQLELSYSASKNYQLAVSSKINHVYIAHIATPFLGVSPGRQV